MSASTRRVRIHSWSFLAVRRGLAAGRLLLIAASVLIAPPMARRTAQQAVTPVRGRKVQQEDVAPLHLDEVQVGNNTLQLYRDGYTLYDAMLTAIDGAR